MREPLRATSVLIGCQPVNTDRFVRDAMEWLGLHEGHVEIMRRGPCYCVSGDDWSGTDESLPLALAAAIRACQAARLLAIDQFKGG